MSDQIFEKPEGISWNPASVELPALPSIQSGEDSMSATISAALPLLHAEMTASVTSLQAKEGMFSGKVVDAQSAYEISDDAGSQSVGQFGSQMGQMAQQAAKSAGESGGSGGGGGGGGVFSQLMEQAMKAVEGATGSGGGESAEGSEAQGAQGQQPTGMAGQAPGGGGGNASNAGDGQKDGSDKGEAQQGASESDERDRKHNEPTERAPLGQPPAAAAGPGDRQHVAGSAPVSPPSSRASEQDLSRNL